MKKRKIASALLATSLAFGTLFTPTTGVVSAKSLTEKASNEVKDKLKQQEKLNKIKEKTLKANGKFKISWDEQKGVPRYISGKLSDKNVDIAVFLEENKDIFNIEDGNFEIINTDTDDLGMTHYRTQFEIDGIPVYGAELIVHTDKSGIVTSLNGQVEPKLVNKKWSQSIKLSPKKAIEVAEQELSFSPEGDTYTAEPKSDLYLYNHENKWTPVFIVELQFLEPYIGREFFYIDAKNGDVLKSYNLIEHAAETGSGTGVFGDVKTINTYSDNGSFYLIDATKSMLKNDIAEPILLDGVIRTHDASDGWKTGSIVSDLDNNFDSSNQNAAVDAHYYAGVVYDYYLDKHNRNSYDDKGSDIVSSVHVRDPDNLNTGWNNAAWVGTQMVYGDGDGTTFDPLSGSLDVVAHELAHAVTNFSADLEYQAQSGALNESFSDVFGILVEADYEGTSDWLLGEDVYTPGVDGDALRSMSDPTLYNQPAHMNNYQNLPVTRDGDWGGVHINSGIPNKAFYNIATKIGLDKSGKIYYRALTKYLTSQSQFIDARNALLQASEDLYGADSLEYNEVAKGYASVGIGSVDDTNDTFGASYQLDPGETYSTTISSGTDIDYYRLNVEQAGQITVNLTNVPVDYDLYLYDSNGQILKKSVEAETSDESIVYSSSTPGTFYVEVVGWNGANSINPYSITATYPVISEEQVPEGSKWFYEIVDYQTPHPYTNLYNDGFTFNKSGVKKVAVHFAYIETEKDYDFVHVKDKDGNIIASYDGTHEDFWVETDGDEISVVLESDESVTAYGFIVDQVKYLNDSLIVD
ncbi:M4 family metallopeptidase [Cytobacillus sp. Hm23]